MVSRIVYFGRNQVPDRAYSLFSVSGSDLVYMCIANTITFLSMYINIYSFYFQK